MRLVSKVVLYVLAISACCVPLLSASASAQIADPMTVQRFDADYMLTNEDPQGLLTITETIGVTFTEPRRGLLRALPRDYRHGSLHTQVTSVTRNGVAEPYITYEENGNDVVRIGLADVYLSDAHEYQITYTMQNVITFYDSYDELYWDVNGDEWLQQIDSVRAEVTTEAKNHSTITPQCFSGSYGEVSQDCTIGSATGYIEVFSNQALSPQETLTFVAAFEKGYFTPMSFLEKYWRNMIGIPLVLLQIVVVYRMYKKWQLYGKDYPAPGVIAPYFDRPKHVSVAQAAYVASNTITATHLSAGIIDLAIRGYVQISEVKEGKKTKHSLTYLKEADDELTNDERMLLSDLFTEGVGSVIAIESMQNKLYALLSKLKKTLDDDTKSQGFYEESPRTAVRHLTFLNLAFIAIFIVSAIIAQVDKGIALLGSGILVVPVIVFVVHMTKRSQRGVVLKQHMDGLNAYLSFSEKERLAQLDAVAAPLASRGAMPEKSVKFFEKLLPFAIVYGAEKTWAQAFEGMYTQAPEWYQGSWSTFTTASLLQSVQATTKATNMTFSAPSSSGSSGFSSGGGFSGGGGGGGGGGSW